MKYVCGLISIKQAINLLKKPADTALINLSLCDPSL